MDEINSPSDQLADKTVDESFATSDSFNFSELLLKIKNQGENLPTKFSEIVHAYELTLNRTCTTATLPYRMAWLGSTDLVHQQILHSATIKALDQLDPFLVDIDKQVTFLRDKIGREEFFAFLESKEGRKNLHVGAIERLNRSATLMKGDLVRAAKDLLLQCLVVIWAAFETFVSDVSRTLLNQKPELLKLLLADEDAKKRVVKAKWNLTDLIEMGLDLSGKVGDLVLSENDLSDYASIKAILLPLLSHPVELRMALNDERLFTLNKLRNVLAHRGGIADRLFEEQTSGRWKEGEMVTITVNDLKDYVTVTSMVLTATLCSIRGIYNLEPIPS